MLKFIFSALLFSAGLAGQARAQQASKPNVLFISVDDLRPELGCYGNTIIHSPNLDRLAGQGVVFKNHFVTVPTCGPSRFSLLTGRLPRTPDELSNAVFERKLAAGNRDSGTGRDAGHDPTSDEGLEPEPGPGVPESFVENLRINGYYTVGTGKISHSADGHIYGYLEPQGKALELPRSWDEMLFDPGKWGTGWNAFFGYADGSNRNDLQKQVKPYEHAEVSDEGYPDGLTANLAVRKLKELAGKKQPFFLGVGFFKPHLPFTAPRKYWDLYEQAEIPLTPSPDIPENVHPASLHESAEFNQYLLGEERASLRDPVSDAYARKLRHAYFASVSYVDAQIGKVLEALKELGLEENTIIVVWGDHGWHLGDHRVWGKHTIFERALRSVLIVKSPASSKGASCERIVSSIDIYPTLMELCGVKTPREIDGESFADLLKAPHSRRRHEAAYGYFRKGITMRTPRYRLTKYFRKQEPVIELYDHRTDPYENRNIAGERPDIVEKLMPLLEKGNTGLYELPD